MFIGKIIGGLIGFATFNVVGAAVGVFVGHFFDKGFSSVMIAVDPAKREQMEAAFFQALFPLMGHMAKADGHISEEEVASTEALIRNMSLDSQGRDNAIALFKRGAESSFDVESTLEAFKTACGAHPELRKVFLSNLIALAFADGHLHETEEAILADVAGKLGYSRMAFNHLLGMIKAQAAFQQQRQQQSQGNTEEDINLAYSALGVERSATDQEVKKAYRKLMSENHPDKLSGQGVPEDMIKLATERSQKIQSAYDVIKKQRKS